MLRPRRCKAPALPSSRLALLTCYAVTGWYILWDPTQATATRPLAIQKDGTWYTYGWDLTKNICEIYDPNAFIRTTYTYSPYGSVTADGDATQPIQWSSEFYDTELGLVYYNYRYYDYSQGRWLIYDRSKQYENLYLYTKNAPIHYMDYIGFEYYNVSYHTSTDNNLYTNIDKRPGTGSSEATYGVSAICRCKLNESIEERNRCEINCTIYLAEAQIVVYEHEAEVGHYAEANNASIDGKIGHEQRHVKAQVNFNSKLKELLTSKYPYMPSVEHNIKDCRKQAKNIDKYIIQLLLTFREINKRHSQRLLTHDIFAGSNISGESLGVPKNATVYDRIE